MIELIFQILTLIMALSFTIIMVAGAIFVVKELYLSIKGW
jgi:hypothetical protein